jgi:serine/threonine protein kinase
MVNPPFSRTNSPPWHRDLSDNGNPNPHLVSILTLVASLNKIPRKRPTFNALLEHPWLLPLSPLRTDFAEVEVANKQMLGEWVTESIAARHAKDASSDTDEEKAKPPLHTVKTEVNKEVNEVNAEPDTTP